jgi:hypothetical protein
MRHRGLNEWSTLVHTTIIGIRNTATRAVTTILSLISLISLKLGGQLLLHLQKTRLHVSDIGEENRSGMVHDGNSKLE